MRGPLRKLLNGPNTYTKLSAAFVCLHPVSPSLVLPTAWPVSLGDDNAISLPLHYPTHHEQAMRKDLFLLIASLVSICAALVGVCVVISKNVHETARAKAQSEFNRQLSGGLDVFDEFFVSRARALRTIADALSALDPVVPTADQYKRVSAWWGIGAVAAVATWCSRLHHSVSGSFLSKVNPSKASRAWASPGRHPPLILHTLHTLHTVTVCILLLTAPTSIYICIAAT